MIQRIQTIFLLSATITASILLFTPIAHNVNSNAIDLFATGAEGFQQWYLHLIFYPCIVFPFLQIFLFKNRIKQLKTGKIAIIYWIVWALIFVLICLLTDKSFENLTPSFGSILPFLSIFFIYLANKSIKKDEELVRSIDRIR